MESGKRSIVLGGPGAGKTTLLRHIALDIASKNLQIETYQYFPIYVKLNEFIRYLYGEIEHEISVYASKLLDFRAECKNKFNTFVKDETKKIIERKEFLLGALEELKSQKSQLTEKGKSIKKTQNKLQREKNNLLKEKGELGKLMAQIKGRAKSLKNDKKTFNDLVNDDKIKDESKKLGEIRERYDKKIKGHLKKIEELAIKRKKKSRRLKKIGMDNTIKRIDENIKSNQETLAEIQKKKKKLLKDREALPLKISEIKSTSRRIDAFETHFFKALDNLRAIKEESLLYGKTQIQFKKTENQLIGAITKISDSLEIIFVPYKFDLINLYKEIVNSYKAELDRLLSEKEKDSVLSALVKNHKKAGFKNIKELLPAELGNNRVLLLLDGFDELSNINNKKVIAHHLKIFIRKYPGNRYIVTSRGAGYEDDLKALHFRKFEIIEFSENQILEFLKNWFANKKEKAYNLFNNIKKNSTVFFLARIPIMLAIIAVLFEERKKQLPNRRVDLFKEISDLLLGRWDSEREIYNKYQASDKRFLLRKIAFNNHTEEKTSRSDKDIIEQIKKYSTGLAFSDKKCRGVFKEIWERSGLIQEMTIKEFGFLHLSFQEYFSALELLNQGQKCYEFIKELFFEKWWKEVFILIAGILDEADNFIEFVENEIDVPETAKKRDRKKAELYKLEMLICMVSEATHTQYGMRKRFFQSIILDRIDQDLSPRLLTILGTDYQKVMFIDSRFLDKLCEEYVSEPVYSEKLLMVLIALQKIDVLENLVKKNLKIYRNKLKAWISTKSLKSCLNENQVDSLKALLYPKG